MNGNISESIVTHFRKQFEANCINGILLGYEKMVLEKIYDVNSVEDNLTEQLAQNIRDVGYLTARNILVDTQHGLHNVRVTHGPANPANSPVIDFKFGTVWKKQNKEHRFYAEAKNLSEKNWRKTNGSTVRAHHSRSYYISDGINRYLTGYYPEGCLIGYVVNGNVLGVVSTINQLIAHRGSSPQIGIIERDISSKSECCYISHNQLANRVYSLRHLFFQLAT